MQSSSLQPSCGRCVITSQASKLFATANHLQQTAQGEWNARRSGVIFTGYFSCNLRRSLGAERLVFFVWLGVHLMIPMIGSDASTIVNKEYVNRAIRN